MMYSAIHNMQLGCNSVLFSVKKKKKKIKSVIASKTIYIVYLSINSALPASVAQLDAPSDWRPGGRGLNPRRGR